MTETSPAATVYTEDNDQEITDLLIGHRIVSAEMGDVGDYPGRGWEYRRPQGLLTLDDGTKLYLAGNECSCCAQYDLEKVASVDNIITAVRVECDPDADRADRYDTEPGVYRIFVLADAVEINVAEFVGTDGSGYYGTGFELAVVRPEAAK
jgi:hypothetical protein